MLDALERMGHPRDVRLGFGRRHVAELVGFGLAQVGFFAVAGLREGRSAAPWAEFAVPLSLVVLTVALGAAVVLRLRSRATLRAFGIELERHDPPVVPWSSVVAARLDRGDLEIEIVLGSERVRRRAFLGRPRARPRRRDGASPAE